MLHYKIIGKGADPGKLSDLKTIRILVSTVVHDCNMRLLDTPQCFDVKLQIEKLGKEPFEDEGGVSCLGCLSTSHVAIHTWPLRQEFHLDVYSCRDYSHRIIKTRVAQLLGGTLYGYDLTYACKERDKPTYAMYWNPQLDRYVAQRDDNPHTRSAKTPEMALLLLRDKELDIKETHKHTTVISYDEQLNTFKATVEYLNITAYGITPQQALQQAMVMANQVEKQDTDKVRVLE